MFSWASISTRETALQKALWALRVYSHSKTDSVFHVHSVYKAALFRCFYCDFICVLCGFQNFGINTVSAIDNLLGVVFSMAPECLNM